jgi:ABC-2 type transport system ATP-binding protein
MIEAERIGKQFGTFEAVRNLSLTVRPGEVLALLGPNGAGKTTTVRMLSAILKPTSGSARVGGHDIVKEARVVRSKVGLLTEYPGLYNRMTALEYLHFFGTLVGLDSQTSLKQAERLLQEFDLWEARHKNLDSYSKGMKQKIALVRALINDPPILFLDEPTTAMDPQSARMVRDSIGNLRANDRTILLTTHNLTEAESLADRIAIIRNGQIILDGTLSEITVELLGDPIWELQLAKKDDYRIMPLLDGLVEPEEMGEGYLRYRCAEPQHINPQILSRLADHQVPVLSLHEMSRNLEQVYLHTVQDQMQRNVPQPTTYEAEEVAV